MLRILLADDHDLTRAGLRHLLESRHGWTICGEASNGRVAVNLAEQLKPDVAIFDMRMPELGGLEAVRQVLKTQPQLKILIYTMDETENAVVAALDSGACGIILKSDRGENIVAAVEAVVRGRRFFTSGAAEKIAEAYLSKKTINGSLDTNQASLTSREHEVVRLLAEGKSNREVADHLQIAVRTAEGHRGEIMRKLKLTSLAELVRFALRNGIIQP